MTELEKILGVEAMQELRKLIREEVREQTQFLFTPVLSREEELASAQASLVDYLTSPIVRDEPLDPESLAHYDPYSEFDAKDKFSDREERTEGKD